MVRIIYGTKGTGKTKKILDEANKSVKTAKGNIIYITDTQEHSMEIPHEIRYINTKDYLITSEDRLIGLFGGLIAGNTDIEYIFIDGVARMCHKQIAELEAVYNYMGKLCVDFGVKFVVTVSSTIENIPSFIKKYL